MNIRQKYRNRIRAMQDWLSRLTYSRKCRIYCVGTSKSGTHSINTMFNSSVRSQHEPESGKLIRKIIEASSKRPSKEEIRRYLRRRDKRLCLDVDSSQLNFFFLDELLSEFADARFLLTIRDVYSWLDSFLNDSLRRQSPADWIMLRQLIFRSDVFTHPPEEVALRKRGLYTLDGYLSYWSDHNHRVLSTVPSSRLRAIASKSIRHLEKSLLSIDGYLTLNKGDHLWTRIVLLN